jgi:hypothetical protein
VRGLGFFIGDEIEVGAEDRVQQIASVIMSAHPLAPSPSRHDRRSFWWCLLCVLRRSKRASAGRYLYATCRCVALLLALSSSISLFSRVISSCRSDFLLRISLDLGGLYLALEIDGTELGLD